MLKWLAELETENSSNEGNNNGGGNKSKTKMEDRATTKKKKRRKSPMKTGKKKCHIKPNFDLTVQHHHDDKHNILQYLMILE